MSKNNLETIPLGSGKIYIKVFDDDVKEKLKTNTGVLSLLPEIEKRENIAGWVSGGASLEYKPEFYTAEDDLGYVKRTIVTKEENTLKTGICTWNGNTLANLSSTARVEENLTHRFTRIGGVGNDDGKQYIIDFHHIDKELGDARIILVGKNEAGFTIQFAKDKESVLEEEIKAGVLDDEGTQVIYLEDLKKTTLHLTSVEGTGSGDTKITVEEAKGTGNSYVYSVYDTIAIPTEGEDCSSMTTWDGVADITADSDKQILIVEVDSSKKAVKAGFTSVVSKA